VGLHGQSRAQTLPPNRSVCRAVRSTVYFEDVPRDAVRSVGKPLLHRLGRRGVPFRTGPRAADPDPLDAGGGSGRPSTPPPPGGRPRRKAPSPLRLPPAAPQGGGAPLGRRPAGHEAAGGLCAAPPEAPNAGGSKKPKPAAEKTPKYDENEEKIKKLKKR